MAYYVDDKQTVENIDINYILDYFKDEQCVRIMWSKSFHPINGDILGDSLIVEPIRDKYKYVYQDGSRVVSIDRNRDICINPYMVIVSPERNPLKSGLPIADYRTEHLRDYIINFKSKFRDNKINDIINDVY